MNSERLKRILLFKPPKYLFNLYSIIAMRTSNLKNEYSRNLEKFLCIGEFDSKRQIHFFKGKEKYRHLFNESDIYKQGEYRIIKKGKVGLATDGTKPLVYKKYGGVFDYEFKSELSCLLRLKNIDSVPNVMAVDFNKRIIYMSYVGGSLMYNVPDTYKKMVKKNTEKTLKDIHSEKIIISDLDARNIIHDNKNCFVVDFGDSINCNLLPKFYFDKLRNIEIFNYNKRVKEKYLK